MGIRGRIFLVAGLLAAVAVLIAGLSIRAMQEYNQRVAQLQAVSQRALYGEHLNRLVTAVVMDSRGIYGAPAGTQRRSPRDCGATQSACWTL